MKSILVVDDEHIVRDVLQRILSQIGYTTVTTDSGELALEAFSEEMFDLVLMDVLMPMKNGFEIAREMKQIKIDQKIVLLTGLDRDAVLARADCEHVNVDNVLSKPFSLEKVKDVLEEVLSN